MDTTSAVLGFVSGVAVAYLSVMIGLAIIVSMRPEEAEK